MDKEHIAYLGKDLELAKKKMKERVKKDEQMDFGFNNKPLKEWKKKTKRDLSAILKILDKR